MFIHEQKNHSTKVKKQNIFKKLNRGIYISWFICELNRNSTYFIEIVENDTYLISGENAVKPHEKKLEAVHNEFPISRISLILFRSATTHSKIRRL